MRRRFIGSWLEVCRGAGFLALLFLPCFNLHAQVSAFSGRTVALEGNRHPLARPELEIGRAEPDFAMQHIILVLRPGAERRAALEAFLDSQNDPASPNFHRWLTPEEFGAQFGVSDDELARVTGWLAGQGFQIDEVPAGGQSIVFSGTAAQVEKAFETSIRTYSVRGEIHHANAGDPRIPEELASIVAGTVSLHDFRKTPMHAGVKPLGEAMPDYTSGGAHYLGPADFATIYDVAPLYTSGVNGAGQSIAIAGRANIHVADVQTFRSMFGLAPNNPTVILTGSDPGILSTNEEAEAYLDVEWAGAVAPQAAIKFVVSASTGASDGVDLSAQYIVSKNVAPVVSVSFGACESQIGAAERAFYYNLWQQAAAQGITALVASGDSGAAGCDSPSSATAAGGQAVNGLCSSPYSVCVGGTEFAENGNYNLYWSSSNNASLGSALSYIPETAWNESGSNGGSGLWATGGGASAYYAKPSWQAGPGVPADAKRDVPDVALAAAGHDGYFVNILGGYYVVSGTSAASPSFAGIVALVNQKTGARQGNINATLYPLAALASSGGAPVFHTITGGNNSVPGLTGFTAGAHYNQATGLGSPDAFLLVNHWTDSSVPVTSAPSFAVSVAATATVPEGLHASVPVMVTVSGGFNSAVTLTVSGMPAGATASFSPATISAPGSSTLTITASGTTPLGSYPLTMTGASGSVKKTATLTVTITPAFAITASAPAVAITRGGSGSVTITTTVVGGFSSAMALSTSVLPSGVTAVFAPASIGAPGSGSSKLTFSVASSAAGGTYPILISAVAGTVKASTTVTLNISAPAAFTLTATPSSVVVARGGGNSTLIQLIPQSGFNGTATVTYSAMPSGITARWSNVAAGAVLSFQASGTAPLGTYVITITGTSVGLSPATVTVILSVTGPATGAHSR
jgi:subtilase family serine protease